MLLMVSGAIIKRVDFCAANAGARQEQRRQRIRHLIRGGVKVMGGTSLSFTEKMQGFVLFEERDYPPMIEVAMFRTAAKKAECQGSRFEFTLTIAALAEYLAARIKV